MEKGEKRSDRRETVSQGWLRRRGENSEFRNDEDTQVNEIGLLGYEVYEDDWHGVRIDRLGVDRTQQSFGSREGVLPVAVGKKKRPEDGTMGRLTVRLTMRRRRGRRNGRVVFDGR